MDTGIIKDTLQTILDNIENKDNSCSNFYEFQVTVKVNNITYIVAEKKITIYNNNWLFNYVGYINEDIAGEAECYQLYNNVISKFYKVRCGYFIKNKRQESIEEIEKIARRLNRV